MFRIVAQRVARRRARGIALERDRHLLGPDPDLWLVGMGTPLQARAFGAWVIAAVTADDVVADQAAGEDEPDRPRDEQACPRSRPAPGVVVS